MTRKVRGLATAAALTATAGLAATAGVWPGAAATPGPTAAAKPAVAKPAVAKPAVATKPVLDWKPCDDGYQCASARVPLNYSDPAGAKISIAVISHRATGPGPGLGWLFFNGGGPNPQVSTMPSFYPDLPAQWRERYNIITWDPRGMGESTQIRCFPSEAAENALLGTLPAFPVGRAQQAVYDRAYARLDARCASDAGPLPDHDSSADIARDMNLIREAVGDPVLNYYGASYATLFGAVYANLFPSTTGRMVLDGNLNPGAWSAATRPVPSFARLDSPQASGATMAAFLRRCGQATTTACAFSAGTPARTSAKWNALLRLVSRHPVRLGGQPGPYTYADLVESVSGRLGSVSQWQSSAVLLQQVWTAAHGGEPAPSPGPDPATGPASGPGYYSGVEQQLAIMCADSPNPRNPAAYAATAAAGTFAPAYAWLTLGCAHWPAAAAQDRYTGPWNRPTASTILVIGNTGDPLTAYQDSVAMSRLLARARLLTVDGYGHTTTSNPSTCVIAATVSYTVTGALPAPGTVCQQDLNPFPAP